MGNYEIKDHGVREEMSTGSQRDTQEGKPRPELIPSSVLTKLAMHYGNGAIKYKSWNWARGSRFLVTWPLWNVTGWRGRTA